MKKVFLLLLLFIPFSVFGVTWSPTGNSICGSSADLATQVQYSDTEGRFICGPYIYNMDGTLKHTINGTFNLWTYIVNDRFVLKRWQGSFCGWAKYDLVTWNQSVFTTWAWIPCNSRLAIRNGEIYDITATSARKLDMFVYGNQNSAFTTVDEWVPWQGTYDAFDQFSGWTYDDGFNRYIFSWEWEWGYMTYLPDVIDGDYWIKYAYVDEFYVLQTGTLYNETANNIYPLTYYYRLESGTGWTYGCESVDAQVSANPDEVQGYVYDEAGDVFEYVGDYNMIYLNYASGSCMGMQSNYFDDISKPEKFLYNGSVIYYLNSSGQSIAYTWTGVEGLVYTAPPSLTTWTGGVDESTFNWDYNDDGDISFWEFFAWIGNTIKAFFLSIVNFFENLKLLIEELMEIGNTEEVNTFSFNLIPTTYAVDVSDTFGANPTVDGSFLQKLYWFFEGFIYFLMLIISILLVVIISRKW